LFGGNCLPTTRSWENFSLLLPTRSLTMGDFTAQCRVHASFLEGFAAFLDRDRFGPVHAPPLAKILKPMTAIASVRRTTEPAEKSPQPAPPDLWRCYRQTKGAEAENALVEEYLPLVRTVVGRLAMTLPAHVSVDDLQSAGLVGLLQALRSFTPHRGASFNTFARFRIRGAVLDELRRMDWIPRQVHDRARKIQNALGDLEQRLGHPPTEEQMALALGLTPDKYRAWLDEIRPAAFVCLDAASGATADGATPHESIPDDSQEDPSDGASRNELKQIIAHRIRQLPPTQQKVLALYYFEDLRLREIAEAFGLTESRISQIHAQAVLAIRSFIERHEGGAQSLP
jgi:RNA polymerase sigma factor FliA